MEGPFRPENDLPGNSGSWLGTQIIMQYARRRRAQLKLEQSQSSAQEIDKQLLQEVLKQNDAQAFLKQYKPPRS